MSQVCIQLLDQFICSIVYLLVINMGFSALASEQRGFLWKDLPQVSITFRKTQGHFLLQSTQNFELTSTKTLRVLDETWLSRERKGKCLSCASIYGGQEQ